MAKLFKKGHSIQENLMELAYTPCQQPNFQGTEKMVNDITAPPANAEIVHAKGFFGACVPELKIARVCEIDADRFANLYADASARNPKSANARLLADAAAL